MKKCKLISLLLVLSIISSLIFSHIPTHAALTESNFSIENEITQSREVQNIINSNDSNNAVAFIPEGATLLSADQINNNLIIDYIFNNERVLVEYFDNGQVEKTIRAIGSNIITVIGNNNKMRKETRKSVDITTLIETTEIEPRELEQIKADLIAGNIEKYDSVIPLETRAAKKDVIPIKYTAVSGTKPFSAKLVASGTTSFTSLSSVGYSTSQAYRIYETMSYHSEIKRSGLSFSVGDSITFLSAAFEVATTTMLGWLNGAAVAVTVYNQISSACRVVDENSYEYLGGKETTVYDPTREKAHVEVCNDWGTGKISLTWNYSGSYRNPSWGHTARSSALMITNFAALNETIRIYNSNITGYGVWKWGRGQLGY